MKQINICCQELITLFENESNIWLNAYPKNKVLHDFIKKIKLEMRGWE